MPSCPGRWRARSAHPPPSPSTPRARVQLLPTLAARLRGRSQPALASERREAARRKRGRGHGRSCP
eukprot:395722-Rhodomonas_salina.1